MFEGILKFTPDLTALIRYDEKTDKTDKAVYIDAEGNETPIGGGGGECPFSIITATVTGAGDVTDPYLIPVMSYYDGEVLAKFLPGVTDDYNLIAYEGSVALEIGNYIYENIDGDAEVSGDWLIITGPCSFTVKSGIL